MNEIIKENKIIFIIIGILILILIIGGIIFSGIFNFSDNSEKKEIVVEKIKCFINAELDNTNIDMKDGPAIDYRVVQIELLDNNKVKGIYNIVPFADQAQRGTFTGVAKGNDLDVDYTYKITDGSEIIKKRFELFENKLKIINSDNNIILKKVSCLDSEFQFNIKNY